MTIHRLDGQSLVPPACSVAWSFRHTRNAHKTARFLFFQHCCWFSSFLLCHACSRMENSGDSKGEGRRHRCRYSCCQSRRKVARCALNHLDHIAPICDLWNLPSTSTILVKLDMLTDGTHYLLIANTVCEWTGPFGQR